ncbi:glycosyltransferase family 4 protein [Alteromonas facilis]|uniref:glycosyltransferase family 4 protein n=1 Tax=Alteromonas facilis TaxID=2048004 RepID=UPI000C28DD87|nr:glycosyltransferase family 4 protein [Alteromonas facilis]
MTISAFYNPLQKSTKADAVNILTVTRAFPIATQPWLINHLRQIAKFGGENRIIATQAEGRLIPSEIISQGLLEITQIVPNDKWALLNTYFSAFKSIRRNDVWKHYKREEATTKQLIFDFLASPSFNVNVDVIHSHSEPVGSKFVRLIKATGKPFVHTFHGLTPSGVPTITSEERAKYTSAARAIFVNTEFARKQYEDIGAQCSNFIIIPQGTDLSLWHFSKRSQLEGRSLKLLTVARLDKEKGHKFAFDAVRQLLRKGVQVQYHLVGAGSYEMKLKDYAKEIGIEKQVTFHGILVNQDIKKIYAESDVFILPSLSSTEGGWEETQGVVIQEAQASGLLVIATNTGGIPECIIDRQTGILVPDRDASSLALAVTEVAENYDLFTKMVERARLHVEQNYDINIIGKKFNEHYQEIRMRD